MNGDVRVLPKKRRPAARKCPESSKPPVDERRSEDPTMRVVVEVDTNVYSCDPTEDRRRGDHEGRSGPWAGDAGELGVMVQPEGACECNEARCVEDHHFCGALDEHRTSDHHGSTLKTLALPVPRTAIDAVS